MAVYKRGETWWFQFIFEGRRIQESAKTGSKTVARAAEAQRRRELEQAIHQVATQRKHRVRTLADVAAVYLREYRLKNSAVTFAEYAVRHLCEHLGSVMIGQITLDVVNDYQIKRLEQKAAPKSINDEVGILLRIMGDRGDLLRVELRRKKKLNLKVGEQPGKAFDGGEKDRMLEAAASSRSPHILAALTLALNLPMRDAEIKRLRWSQIDFSKRILTVGKAKSAAGEGRTIPLNSDALAALIKHAAWYAKKFGEAKPDRYVFPFGRRGHMDPTRPVTTLKTAWGMVRKKGHAKGRWHDTRHTVITELAESGAGSETIKALAGHVSTRMLERYSHIRIAAKRSALEEVVANREKERAVRQQSEEQPAHGTVN